MSDDPTRTSAVRRRKPGPSVSGQAGMRAGLHTTGPALEACYRFLLWLVPTLEKFPRSQKWGLPHSEPPKGSGSAFPADYWSGVVQRCLLRPAETAGATKAMQRATQTPTTVPNAEFYRLIAASHLRCQAKGMGCGAECEE